jgi:hypothetical protein
MIEKMKRMVENKKLTPLAVKTFAALAMTDDSGYPIIFSDHHDLWLELICDDTIKRLLIIAPPDSAKTTVVIAYLAAWIGFHQTLSAIVSSVTDDVATKRSVSVRNLVTSDVYRMIFPKVIPSKNEWEQNGWSVNNRFTWGGGGRLHRTMSAYGTGTSIVGSRADLLIGDDLLDFDNTRTSHQIDLINKWFYNSFLSRCKGGVHPGRVVLIGTSWNASDLLGSIRRENGDWIVCHMPMLDESGNGFHATLSYPDGWDKGHQRSGLAGRTIIGERRS